MIWYLNGSAWMKMKNKKSKKKCIRSSDALFSTMERLKIGLLLLILAVFFQFLARNVNGFAQWYATSIYRMLVTIISRVCSVFPFSIVEILLYVLLVVLAAGGDERNLQNLQKNRKDIHDCFEREFVGMSVGRCIVFYLHNGLWDQLSQNIFC